MNYATRNIVVFFLLTIALNAASADVTEIRLRLEVTPRVSTAPAVVRIRVIVAPDATNRALHIIVDSESFYRSSVVPLDGANAAAITETMLRNLPSGDYEVIAALIDGDGRRIVDQRERISVLAR
jgi:hypothetical protein